MLLSRPRQITDSPSSGEDRLAASPENHDRIASGRFADTVSTNTVLTKAVSTERVLTDTVSIDRHLRERILERLAQRGIRLSSELTLAVHQRAVTVRGRVDSYYQRQLIIHSIRLVPGIGALEDAVDVAPPADPRRFLCQPGPPLSRQRGLSPATASIAAAMCPS